jgi:hypothetical protein
MDTIIWAMGAMLVLMVILYFLKLGLSLIGKMIIVSASLILGLGGTLAANTFPLWLSLTILLVLTFLIAFFMDSRIGHLFYISNSAEEVASEIQATDDESGQEIFAQETLLPITFFSEPETEAFQVSKGEDGDNLLLTNFHIVERKIMEPELKMIDPAKIESLLINEFDGEIESLEEDLLPDFKEDHQSINSKLVKNQHVDDGDSTEESIFDFLDTLSETKQNKKIILQK